MVRREISQSYSSSKICA